VKLKSVAWAAVVTAAVVLAGGMAFASIPAPDGTINGCRKKADGSLRVIDSTATCPNGYTALNWNQTGPQGPNGDTGPSNGYGVRVNAITRVQDDRQSQQLAVMPVPNPGNYVLPADCRRRRSMGRSLPPSFAW